MKYIFNRYQRWKTEIKNREADADILANVKDAYLGFSDYQRREMFGDGSKADWARAFMDKYIDLYRKVVAQRGDKPWPLGGGPKIVQKHVFDLLKKQLTRKMSQAEVDYEARKMAADWGWIAKSAVGEPPPSWNAKQFKTKSDQLARIQDRLSRLDYKKLMTVMDYMHVKLPNAFMRCLCSINPAGTGSVGYITTPRKDCPGPCTGGVLNCVSWTPRADAEGWKTCMGRVSMPDGARIDEYIAKRLLAGVGASAQ